MDDRHREVWSWRRSRRQRPSPSTWSGEERRRPHPRPVDPGLRALLDDLARLDGRGPLPSSAEPRPVDTASGPTTGDDGPGAEVVVLPTARPSAGAGPGWAEVVDLEAFRSRRRP